MFRGKQKIHVWWKIKNINLLGIVGKPVRGPLFNYYGEGGWNFWTVQNLFIYFTSCLQYFIYFTHCKNIYFTFLKCIFSVYKVGSQTRLSIDVGAKETSEARLHTLKRFLRAIKYLFTACPNSDNYFFHEKEDSKYLFLKYSSPPPPKNWMVAPYDTHK